MFNSSRRKDRDMMFYRTAWPASQRRGVPSIYWVIVSLSLLVATMLTVKSWPDNPLASFVQPWLAAQKSNAQPSSSSPTYYYANLKVFPSNLVARPPSLSAQMVDRVLAAAHSPAGGLGNMVFQLSQQDQVDDAFVLAVFHEESNYGLTGVARYTHSWGNIKCSPGYVCFEGFRNYADWGKGVEDFYRLLHDLYIHTWHLTTVEQIIPIASPASDHNDPPAYIAHVEADMARWREGKV